MYRVTYTALVLSQTMDSVDGLLLGRLVPPCIHHEHVCPLYQLSPHWNDRYDQLTICHCAVRSLISLLQWTNDHGGNLQIQTHSACFERDEQDDWVFILLAELFDRRGTLWLGH